MKYELISEENADQFSSKSELPNLLMYPIKKIDENIYQVGKKETVVFWGTENGVNLKTRNVSLKPIGSFDGKLEEALEVLKSSLPPSQAFLIYVEGNNICREMVPLFRN